MEDEPDQFRYEMCQLLPNLMSSSWQDIERSIRELVDLNRDLESDIAERNRRLKVFETALKEKQQ